MSHINMIVEDSASMRKHEFLPEMPLLPPKLLMREVTQQDEHFDSSSSLQESYTEYSSKFNSKTDGNMSDSNRPTYDQGSASPLIFQSNLSSLSKEETSSEEAGESTLNNKKSIFRPRQEVPMQPLGHDEKDGRNESMPNLLSNSSLEFKRQSTEQHSSFQKQSQGCGNLVTANYSHKSFDYSSHENYPLEVIIDQSRKRPNPSNLQEANDLSRDRRKSQFRQRLIENSSSITRDFYHVLQSHTESFMHFKFLLPGLKSHVFRFIQEHSDSNAQENMDLTPLEVNIARRRLKSAIHLFGGNMNTPKNSSYSASPSFSSIFRTKGDGANYDLEQNKTRKQIHYEQQLPLRFYENETRLSWDAEEEPPVENGAVDDKVGHNDMFHNVSSSNHLSSNKLPSLDNEDSQRNLKPESYRSQSNHESLKHSKSTTDSTKTRYRCKLCGQPKQNHTCPYQQSLQRNIGTMSYPALNSFECSEPGKLATPLAEMNNFFHLLEDNELESVPSSTMTPSKSLDCESFGLNLHNVKPGGNLAFDFDTAKTSASKGYIRSLKGKKRKISIKSSFLEKASDEFSEDVLLLDKADMKPEQCRAVSTCSSIGSYSYSTIPLTYVQRKSMSDSLYNLSKEISGLTDECSAILQEAKETPSWDLAVAELTTQVLVILHCPSGDRTLEGLCKYLMSVGISC